MKTGKKLPIGIEDFKEIRTLGFYYIDKTGLIAELLDNWSKVNLFTRPRRFGKSLNMSMLHTFFEYGCNPELFAGLEIAENKRLCEKYMGKFPVISISLKNVEGNTFDTAFEMLQMEMQREVRNNQFLLESDVLTEIDKRLYHSLIELDAQGTGSISKTMSALKNLSYLLCKHYQQKVILLIDEYDVPLNKAQQYGFYNEMLELIRNMFGQALKTNENLYFAVLTGCLRISKESIFTGLNNFRVLSITNLAYEEHFGFCDAEIKQLLDAYGLQSSYERVKDWYDGYHFGNTDVYCPWDVINYVEDAKNNPEIEPVSYWMNTSENAVIKAFLQMAQRSTMREIERLINGEHVTKKIVQDLTYGELYQNLDHVWSVLFMTGYLTGHTVGTGGIMELSIPNLGIKAIFMEQILTWFQEKTQKEPLKLHAFCNAFEKKDVELIETQLNSYLSMVIGIHDYSIRQELKENYYHGLLVGLLMHFTDWEVSSNPEAGLGYSDIQLEVLSRPVGIIIEVKYQKDGNLEAGCNEALAQIDEKQYEQRLKADGITKIIKYGIAFYKKSCKVCMK